MILDVLSEAPINYWSEHSKSYAFLLVGQFVQQGEYRFPSSEAVCLLLKKTSLLREEYTRVGFVLRAFHTDAWKSGLATKMTILIV